MEKIIKVLFEQSFIYNNKCYVLTCTRDLINKTGLVGSTIRSNLKKLIDIQILIDTKIVIQSTGGPEDYHASDWNLYEFNLSYIDLKDRYPIPALTWNLEKALKNNKEGNGD